MEKHLRSPESMSSTHAELEAFVEEQGREYQRRSVSAYADDACTDAFASHAVGTEAGLCVDVMAGVALKSMSATWTTNRPGSCEASGGELLGEATPTHPSTFCCQPLPTPPH